MRTFIALLATLTALACSAASAVAMPADPVSRPATAQPEAPSVSTTTPADDDGTLPVVIVGSCALLAGAGVGFAAARVTLRPKRFGVAG
jgi:hypothetical protein